MPNARDPAALLWEVRQAQHKGEFEAVWNTYLEFFDHPDRNEVDIIAFGHCFGRLQCPSFGILGAFLGKAKSEAKALEGFCPKWQGFREKLQEESPKDLEHFPWIRDRLIKGSIGDCERWPSRQSRLLHQEQIARDGSESYLVPLRLRQASPGNFVPEVEILIGESSHWALVDTGSTLVTLRISARKREQLGLSESPVIATGRSLTAYGVEPVSTIRIPRLGVGNDTLTHVLADLLPIDPGRGELILGMNILLQYRSVCFAWTERKLYLGNIGPCVAGAQPFNGVISAHFTPHLLVSTNKNMSTNLPIDSQQVTSIALRNESWTRPPWIFPLLIDTGANRNYCSNEFAEALGERQRFSFGDNDMEAGCTGLSGDVTYWHYRGMLGMDALLTFAAFGWQRDPLKFYFVPKPPDS